MFDTQHSRDILWQTPGCGRRHLTWVGLLWSLPNTLLGLGFALLSLTLPEPRDGVLVARSKRGLAHVFLTRRGFGAITFGRVVTSAVPVTPHLLMHETHHIRQYEVLGPFFLPIYLYQHARRGYWNNPLECEAEICSQHAVYR